MTGPQSRRATLEPVRDRAAGTLADVVDAVLDKGLVINADIVVALAGVELLGIRIRAAVASFQTAARYGLEFPSGTNLEAPAWQVLAAEAPPAPLAGPATPVAAGRAEATIPFPVSP